MNGDETLIIPYIVHDGIVARGERIIRRLIGVLIICIILLFTSNAAWLYAWMQYDYSSEAVMVDSHDGGNANYIGENGSIVNGKGDGAEEDPH